MGAQQSNRKRRGRGEGGLFQRADGVWCASFSAGYGGDGKRRRKVVYAPTKKGVQEKLHEEMRRGFVETSRLTLAQFLERWLETTVRAGVAPTTHLRYEQTVRLHIVPHVGHLQLSRLQPIHVEQLYHAQRAANASTRHQQMAGLVLQRALKHAVRLRLLTHNPCLDVDKPRPSKRELKVWDHAQATAFLQAAKGDRLEALYVLALTSGMRQGELFGLEWADVDFGSAAITVNRSIEELKGHCRAKEPKTAAGRRRIDLPQVAIAALHAHRKRMLVEGHVRGPIFCDWQGGYLRKSNVLRRSFRPLIERANTQARADAEKRREDPALLPVIRFHDLRHTAATLLLLQGVHPKVVSERLGHARVEITLNVYSHVLPSMQKEAAAKLDELFG